MCAGIGLYLLVADGEPGAEVYSAAVDRSQASIVFREAASMAEKSPALASRLRIHRNSKTITYEDQVSFYRALSREVSVQERLNIHGLIFDELHAQRTDGLWNTLRYGGSARRQPLLIAITTARYDPNSICRVQHDYARKVLEGIIQDESFFAYIWAAGESDDWIDPDVWRKANPSFGVTIDPDQLAEDCREARQAPAQENIFKRYRLNIWTEQHIRWLPMARGYRLLRCGRPRRSAWPGVLRRAGRGHDDGPDGTGATVPRPGRRLRPAAFLLGAAGQRPRPGAAGRGPVPAMGPAGPDRADRGQRDRLRGWSVGGSTRSPAPTRSARSPSTA